MWCNQNSLCVKRIISKSRSEYWSQNRLLSIHTIFFLIKIHTSVTKNIFKWLKLWHWRTHYCNSMFLFLLMIRLKSPFHIYCRCRPWSSTIRRTLQLLDIFILGWSRLSISLCSSHLTICSNGKPLTSMTLMDIALMDALALHYCIWSRWMIALIWQVESVPKGLV